MLRLIDCTFDGLAGFSELHLSDLKTVTTFIGPNGGGKSTVLRVIRMALEILKLGTFCNALPEHEAWDHFTKATLTFTKSEPFTKKEITDLFPGQATKLAVTITCDDKNYLIQSLTIGDISILAPPSVSTKEDLIKAEEEISKRVNEIAKNEANIMQHQQSQNMHVQVSKWRQDIPELNANLESAKAYLKKLNQIEFEFTNPVSTQEFKRDQADNLLRSIGFPAARYISTNANHDAHIQGLIEHLFTQKKGNWREHNKYINAIEKLKHILQAHVDVFEGQVKNNLTVNDIDHAKASTGTVATLSFYSVTTLDDPNGIVLWDEPENGLHPTRRHRLLEMMFDDSRQFFIASHSPEFAPVFSDEGRVFRCSSSFDNSKSNVILSVTHIADRRDAFATLELLGVDPARTLFTANVVIWVEGPTELLFYRHWLTPHLTALNLYEGFHYAFMQYGGALINYLSVADDGQFESTFDLLSVCRHPIVLVDWDHDSDAGTTPVRELLKTGAQKMYDGIEKVNKERPNAGRFLITGGREIENYLPNAAIKYAMTSVWKPSKEQLAIIEANDLDVAQYDSFDEKIEEYLKSLDIVDAKGKSCGRSLWKNKVVMMQHALKFPDFKAEDLRWNCASQLSEIRKFVQDKVHQ